MVMPFGKYRGTPLEELPFDYLKWLSSQDWVHDPLRWQIRRAYSKAARKRWEEFEPQYREMQERMRWIKERLDFEEAEPATRVIQ